MSSAWELPAPYGRLAATFSIGIRERSKADRIQEILLKALSRFQTETQARVFFAAVIRAALAAGSFHLEALRETGVNLHGWRHAVEAEIGADVELHVRDDDPRERHIEARLGGLDRGVIVIVRP